MSSKRKGVATPALLRKLKQTKSKSECKGNKNKTQKENKCINRRFWVQPLFNERVDFDIEAHLLKDLFWQEEGSDFSRLNIHEFENILSLIHECLKKTDTNMRAAIPPRTKLATTLRFLATGDSYRSLENLTKTSKSTISAFIPIVLQAIYDSLKAEYMKVPNTEEEWEEIAQDFNYLWQFPHTLGALHGKHIRVKASGIVLFALVNAHSRFIFIDVGTNGKASSSSIFQDGVLYKSLKNSKLNIPQDRQLTENGNKIPYFFIGDDEFKLDKNVMKPYSRTGKLNMEQQAFNYRLCHARTVVECAFGDLSKRFNIFNRPIEVSTSTVELIVMTTCVLHNYLTKDKTTPIYSEFQAEDLTARTLSPIGPQQNQTYKYACRIRDELSQYCVSVENNIEVDETMLVEIEEPSVLPEPSKRPRKDEKSKCDEALEKVITINSNENELATFGASVAFQLQNLPEDDAYSLMAEIQHLITKTKLENLRNCRVGQAAFNSSDHSSIFPSTSENASEFRVARKRTSTQCSSATSDEQDQYNFSDILSETISEADTDFSNT